jgi:tRNA(Ile2) C34 agmatinyltransferase TiaS
VTREELEAYTLAVLPVYRNDSGVTTYDFDKILNRLYHPSSTPPICEECNEEMDRYEDSADTGKGGYQCSLCGWSQDDE